MVGGATRSRSAMIAATVSTAPAPPSRCPVIDLVADTTTRDASDPSAVSIARASSGSPPGVEVACALMCTTWPGRRPRRCSAALIANVTPSPSGAPSEMWCASEEYPAPAATA